MDDINEETLAILETRLIKLEDKILGKDAEINVSDKQNDDVVSTLALLGGKLGNALSTRDRMMMVIKRLEELERYLDPSYGESFELSDEVKADLIIAQEEKIYNEYEQLSKLMTMKKYLDSQTISDALNSLNSDLIKNWQHYETTSKLAQEQSEKIADVLKNYNEVIATLTETFIRMDDIVTKAEISASMKKVLD